MVQLYSVHPNELLILLGTRTYRIYLNTYAMNDPYSINETLDGKFDIHINFYLDNVICL